MYAIIEDSGTQIKVSSGDIIDIDLRPIRADEQTVTFDKVLLVADADPDKPATVGTPYVAGASVEAAILDEVKGPKIDVVKFKRRKGYRVKTGHRQPALRVRIGAISG